MDGLIRTNVFYLSYNKNYYQFGFFMNITFEPLKEVHFCLLLKWLEEPHVKKYWDTDIPYTLESIRLKYLSYVRRTKRENGVDKPIYAYVINLDNTSIGYIQIYHADDFEPSKSLTDLPPNLAGLDFYIGEPSYLGKNLGSTILQAFLQKHAEFYENVFVAVDCHNIAAMKCYEKAGCYKIDKQHNRAEIYMIKSLHR